MENSLKEAGKVKVLLVDDDQDYFILIKDILSTSKNNRFTVTYADCYEDGLSLLTHQTFDAALVDYRLDQQTGIALVREAVARGSKTPSILLTGYPGEEIDLQALQAGAVDYLDKSELTPAVLERTIRYAGARKQAEDAKQGVEQKLRYQAELLANVSNPIVATDPNFLIVYWNKAAEETFGWTEAEVLGRDSKDIFQVEIQDSSREKAIRELMDTDHYAGEVIYRRKNGETITALVTSHVLRGEQGEFLGSVTNFQDISQRKRIEEELRVSEQRYRELVKYAPAAIYEIDFKSRRFITVNDVMCELSGYSREELLNLDPFELLDPPSQSLFRKRIIEWMSGHKPPEVVEYRVRTKDGREIYTELSTTFLSDANGNPVGATVIGLDVTDRRQAQIYSEAINQINDIIHSSLDIDETLNKAMIAGSQALGCDTAGISLRTGDDWTVQSVYGMPEKIVGAHMNDDHERHAVLAIKTKNPVAVHDAFNDERFNREHLRQYGIRSVLVVPIILKNDAIGVIFFNYQKSPFDFKDIHIDFATKLAAIISLALENSQLIQDLKKEINERKQAQERAEWMALFPKENPNPVLRVANNGQVLFHNAATANLFGDADLLGKLIPDPVKGLVDRAIAEGREQNQDVPIHKRYYAFSVVPFPEAGYVNIYGRDVTAWVQAEWELKKSEERFRLSLSSAPVVVATLDRELRLTWIYNSRVGYTTEQVYGKPYEEILQEEKPDKLRKMFQSVIEMGSNHRQEVIVHARGKRIVLDVSAAPMHGNDGNITGIIVVGYDITKLRELEEEHIQQRARIEIQRRLIRQREMERLQIARDLHDGPFQSLHAANMGLLDTIRQEDHPEHLERLQWVRDTFQQQIQEFRDFIQDLRPPVLVSFGLETTIRSQVARFHELYPEIQIRLDLMKDQKILPEETRLALYRIYQEIMNNAGKHAHASQINISLRVEAKELILEVKDDGIGFDVPEQWSELALSDHLGLIGIRERAEMLGASLDIQSKAGHGTLVRVRVPTEEKSPEKEN